MMDYAVGTGGRKVVLVMRAGENVIENLLHAFEASGLKNAVITAFYGSMTQISYAYAIPDAGRYYGFRYGETIRKKGLIEVVSGQGMICRNGENQVMYHLHAAFCDETGAVMVGHIMPEDNLTLGTMEILLEEVEGVEMKREMDRLVGGAILTVKTRKQRPGASQAASAEKL